jgi:hypothetical protein
VIMDRSPFRHDKQVGVEHRRNAPDGQCADERDKNLSQKVRPEQFT